MKVCLLCREYPPVDGGGIGAYMHRYAHALAALGCKVTVVTASAGGAERRSSLASESGEPEVVEIPVAVDSDWIGPSCAASDAEAAAFHALGPSSMFAMAAARYLPGLHESRGFDIVEAPETGAALWFVLNARRMGGGWHTEDDPTFVTHVFSPSEWIEIENRCPATSRGELALRWMEGDAARWSDAVVCSSRDLARWAEHSWGLGTGSVDLFPPPLEPSNGAARPGSSDPRRLLYVGRLEPRKGIDVLLAAFVRACEQVENLRLEVVGTDMTDARTGGLFGRRSVELIVPEELRGRIRLHGQCDEIAMAGVRAECFAAIVPGAWDNYPYSCAEAMAHAMPVIGARSGGVSELVRDGEDGVLFEPGDIDACAESIVTLACKSASALREMGEAASLRVSDVCNPDSMVRQRVAHYVKLRNERGPMGAAHEIGHAAILLNANEEQSLAPLIRAVRGGVDFAYGWPCSDQPPGVHVCPTPTAQSLAVFKGQVGPLAVSADALGELAEVEMIHTRRCDDPHGLILRLLAIGRTGAVVPEVQADADERVGVRAEIEMDPLAPVFAAWAKACADPRGELRGMTWRQRAEAAEGELDQLQASRSYKLVTSISALARVLPGRGRRQRIDYDPPL